MTKIENHRLPHLRCLFSKLRLIASPIYVLVLAGLVLCSGAAAVGETAAQAPKPAKHHKPAKRKHVRSGNASTRGRHPKQQTTAAAARTSIRRAKSAARARSQRGVFTTRSSRGGQSKKRHPSLDTLSLPPEPPKSRKVKLTAPTAAMIASAYAGGLYILASRSGSPGYWPALRRFAGSSKDRDQKGFAYFALGYREYEAGQYSAAVADLGQAVDSRCTLADLATYYQAEAAWAGHDDAQAVTSLEGFAGRFPESVLVEQASGLLANGYLRLQQPDRALRAVKADPGFERTPALILLAGKAYQAAHKLDDAARSYQEVYYRYPVSAQAEAAAGALETIRGQMGQMGSSFPQASEQDATNRADFLLAADRYEDALADYRALLARNPDSGSAGKWTVGEASSLVGLRRAADAINLLRGREFKNAEAESGRLEALVEAGRRQKDEHFMLEAFSGLEKRFPHSPDYITALWTVSNYYLAQDERAAAVRYYEVLESNFPLTWQGREAQWRATWSHYLEGDCDEAESGFKDHLKRYPGSPHGPGALYWLGRIQERRGDPAGARALYQMLRRRFVNDYYSTQAGLRLAVPSSGSSNTDVTSIGSTHSASGLAFASQLSLAAKPEADSSWIEGILKQIPRRSPAPEQYCAAVALNGSNGILRTLRTIRALGLDSLEESYVKRVLADHPPDPSSGVSESIALRLALSRHDREDGRYSMSIYDARRAAPNAMEYDTAELPQEIWDLLYPRAFWDLVRGQSRANGLDAYLVMALIRQESGFNPKATSVANARGLMQMLPVAAGGGGRSRRSRRVADALYNPSYNVRVACRFLRGVLNNFGGKPEFALAAYNAGDGRVKGWLGDHSFDEPAEFVESIPFNETRLYVQTVLRDATVYRMMLSGSARFGACE